MAEAGGRAGLSDSVSEPSLLLLLLLLPESELLLELPGDPTPATCVNGTT